MNNESHYVFDDESYEQEGLGRLPAQLPTIHRSLPGPEETRRKKRIIGNRKQPKTPPPRPIPRPRLIPRPVIDKNPVPPPPKRKPKPKPKVSKQSKTKKKATSKKKTRSRVKVQKKKKPAVKNLTSKGGGMLDGTVKVGGLEIKKKHAAVAGGATAGGLLLWKLLF